MVSMIDMVKILCGVTCDYKDAKDIGFEENDGNSSEYTEKKIDSKECKQLYKKYKDSKPKKY